MVRVLIADDHDVVREGIKGILNEAGIDVVGEAANAGQLLQLTTSVPFDVVILDLGLPDASGMHVLTELKQQAARVIVYSAYPEEKFGARTILGGARGFVSKDQSPEDLIKAVRAVSRGVRFVSPAVADQLLWDTEINDQPHEKLSRREKQVFQLLGEGHSVTEISQILGISFKTVSTYRSRILEKMRLANNAELISYYMRHLEEKSVGAQS
ncbi:MAG: DNA-binding response regulator [Acidobacteria bacterium]|nr:MAG: DNA-binding response regulator [Acidobacteriota bacterium]